MCIRNATGNYCYKSWHKGVFANLLHTYFFIEEFTRLFLDRVNKLHLPSREAHKQRHALSCGSEVIKVMASGLCSLVYSLVYWLT